MAAIQSGHFADSLYARLIALAIVVFLGAILYVYWAEDMTALFEGERQAIPLIAEQEAVKEANPALQACLDERVGDVDQMKSEGVINDAQYASFRQRAEELCSVQHPN